MIPHANISPLSFARLLSNGNVAILDYCTDFFPILNNSIAIAILLYFKHVHLAILSVQIVTTNLDGFSLVNH